MNPARYVAAIALIAAAGMSRTAVDLDNRVGRHPNGEPRFTAREVSLGGATSLHAVVALSSKRRRARQTHTHKRWR